MSYPLIAMSRYNPRNRLNNSNFAYAMIRKLHLFVYDPSAPPLCWCGTTHDCYGDHEFSCKQNNKIGAHNFGRDWLAGALQKPLATA
ncbi:hypothetical protein ACHAXR_000031, partial [Thalassiosira sp. AJA248-18]